MDESVLRALENVGFSSKEALIYTALLELGQGDITSIAQKANLKRSNIYPLLEKLEDQGYVSQVPGSTVRRYIPVDPTRILYHLQSNTTALKEMLPFIRGLYNQPGHKPRVQYFEGEKGVTSVYKEINQFPEVSFITSLSRFKQAMPDDYTYWFNGLKTGAVKYKARFLLPKTNEDAVFAEEFKNTKHSIRWLPTGHDIAMEFALYSNKVAISSFSDPIFIVVIESDTLRQSVQEIFEIIWNIADREN